MNDEELWNRYNSNAKVGMSAEEIDRAKAWAAQNGKVFDGTVTETEQDRRKARDAAAVASRTPEQQEAMKQIYAPKEDTSTLGEKAVGGLLNIGAGIAKGADDVTKDASLGNNFLTAGYGGVDDSITGEGNKAGNKGGSSVASSSGNNGADDNRNPGNAVGDLADANPKETKRYTNSMMGIWDSFREGKIDQGTALYFTLDSIAKLARNTGKDLNNIAAAFTGGTMNNEREDSLWSQRRNKMFENELSSEVESQYGSPAWRSKQHDLNSLSMEDKDLVAKDISNWIAENSKGLTISDLQEKLRAIGISNDVTEAMNWLKIDLGNKAKAGDKDAANALRTLDGLNTFATPITNAAAMFSMK